MSLLTPWSYVKPLPPPPPPPPKKRKNKKKGGVKHLIV